MKNRIIETEELAELLLANINEGITRWTHQEIYVLIGYNPKKHPKRNTLAHFRWGQERGQRMAAVNKYFERKKIAIRITIDYGSKNNGEYLRNEWRAVPKDEALNWFALESAKKILSPMMLSIGRAIGYSNADELPLETQAMFKAIAAVINSASTVVLRNAQGIDGLEESTIKELEQWQRRKSLKYNKLLGEKIK